MRRDLLIIFLFLFIHSGLLKWLPFPVDPTLLFFLLTLFFLVFTLKSISFDYQSLGIILVIILFFIWILISSFYTISQEYWKEKLYKTFITLPAFILPILIFKEVRHFIFFRSISIFFLIVALVILSYEYIDNLLYRILWPIEGVENKIPDYLVISLFLGSLAILGLSLKKPYKFFLLFYSVCFIIMLAARGPLIFLIISLLFLLVLKGMHSKIILGFMAFTLIIFFASSIPIFERTISRFSSLPFIGESVDTSVSGRYIIYSKAFRSIQENPILGTGIGGFAMSSHGVDGSSVVHNIFLEVLVELGAIGFLIFSIFISLVAILLFKLYRFNRWDSFSISLIVICLYQFLELQISSKMEEWRIPFFFLGLAVAYFNTVTKSQQTKT